MIQGRTDACDQSSDMPYVTYDSIESAKQLKRRAIGNRLLSLAGFSGCTFALSFTIYRPGLSIVANTALETWGLALFAAQIPSSAILQNLARQQDQEAMAILNPDVTHQQ